MSGPDPGAPEALEQQCPHLEECRLNEARYDECACMFVASLLEPTE